MSVVDPSSFEWPGRFIGRWASGSHCVLFGMPPGVVAGPVEPPLEAALVLAPVEPVPLARSVPTAPGAVSALFVAPEAEAPMVAVPSVTAVVGHGLEGDRYFDGGGTFSGPGGTGHELTLVDADALAAAGVTAEESRRNVVATGIDLDALMGRRFLIGEVEVVGRRRCEPCAHLQRLTRPGVLRSLVHRGGLRADIVTGGTIAVGDPIRAS